MRATLRAVQGRRVIFMTPVTGSIDSYPRHWGIICTPSRWSRSLPPGRVWCGDNEAFTGKFAENPERFFAWLQRMEPYRDRCLFIAVPDAICDPYTTRLLWIEHAPRIKALGYPVAFVCQDGQEHLPFPPDADAFFIGGSTNWKLGTGADACIRIGKAQGIWVHVGRVNSQRRIAHFQLIGVDSVDGTGVARNPRVNFPRYNTQLLQSPLFTLRREP